MHRFIKLSFTFAAILLLSPLALSAQATAPKWTGVHVGVIGGVAGGNYNLHLTSGVNNADFDSSFAGGRVGVHGGVDFNVKGLVLGALADWSWSNAQFKFTENDNVSFNLDLHSKIKQMTTVRGRVGHSYGRVLPYVHGGLLVANTEFIEAGNSTTVVNQTGTHNGFVVGGGFEYFVAPRVSLSTEYGYNHLSGIPVTESFFGGSGITTTENPHFSTVTVGFNYHF